MRAAARHRTGLPGALTRDVRLETEVLEPRRPRGALSLLVVVALTDRLLDNIGTAVADTGHRPVTSFEARN